MVIRRRLKASLCAALFAGALVPTDAWAHPLHTTYAEVTVWPRNGMLRAMIRVFADDFRATALRSYPSGARSSRDFERASYTYAARRFRLTDAHGASIPLGWCGLRRDGNFIWLCIGSDHFSATGKLQLTDELLQEVFSDQINLVKLTAGGRTDHLLFAGGSGPKEIKLPAT